MKSLLILLLCVLCLTTCSRCQRNCKVCEETELKYNKLEDVSTTDSRKVKLCDEELEQLDGKMTVSEDAIYITVKVYDCK